MTAAEAAAKFRYFATVEAVGSSSLYCALAAKAAADSDLMQLAAEADSQQPLPALFLGCAELILRRTARSFSEADSFEEAWEQLEDVLANFREEFRDLLLRRRVQTNEVRRSLIVFAAICRVAAEWPGRPIALVELGSSAGFNLLPDRYGYELSTGERFGNPDSPLRLPSEVRGLLRPPVGPLLSPIVRRIGIDLDPVDLDRPEEVEWLRALIWPEHHDRRTHLDQAIQIRKSAEIEVIRGDAVACLPEVLTSLEGDILPVVFHTHFFNQLSEEERTNLLGVISEFGTQRDLVHFGNNMHPWIHAVLYRSGQSKEIPLAYADHHARWIEWLDHGSGMETSLPGRQMRGQPPKVGSPAP